MFGSGMRSVRDLLGTPDPEGAALVGTQSAGAQGQLNAVPLGARTGAPPLAQLRTYQVIPATAVGVAGQQATLVVDGAAASRVVIFLAPLVAFSIFVGDSGVGANPGTRGLALPPGLAYEVIVPGGQDFYAVTDAPVFLPLRVQIAPLLIGDRERR